MAVSMPTSQPTRSVAIGRYVLAVGAPAGTLISAGVLIDTAAEGPAELAGALERESDERRTTGEVVEGAVVTASDATKRVEQAEDLLRAALEGSLLDPDDLSARVGVLFDVLQRLDRDGRWEESLRLARAINGLLALAMRWADLVRTLLAALRAADRLPDAAAAVAWAEHELGTLHLAAGDAVGAERRLASAREIRRRLGDREGLAVTEQSLSCLCRQQVREGRLQRRRGPLQRLALALTVALLLLAGGVAGAVVDPFDAGGAARLTVQVDGLGTVTTTPPGISCPDRCAADFVAGRSVSLTAAAQPGSRFAGWSGDCQGARRCRLRLDGARSVSARFVAAPDTRTVSVRTVGDGRVTSPSGIDCGSACRASVVRGSPIRLVATAGADATFTGWRGGGCEGTGPCEVTVDESVTIAARFAAAELILTVTKPGAGSGIVISRPVGISCGEDCSQPFPGGGDVLLTAKPQFGSDFAGWSEAGCPGTGTTCSVTLSDPQTTVQATFDLESQARFVLTTSTSGPGTISPDCANGCAFPQGTEVALTATPSDGANTVRWTGCTPTGPTTCEVTMSQDLAVSASFSFAEP